MNNFPPAEPFHGSIDRHAHPDRPLTLKLAREDYSKLSAETAQRTLRFRQLHNKIGK
jgi:hypothetical protein